MKTAIELCQDFIRCESITPTDAGCQTQIANYLETLGFRVQHFPHQNVSNLFAEIGAGEELFVFAGHTDVVPVGDVSRWTYPPFSATIADDQLWGRGVADMKASLAAMLTATRQFLRDNPQPNFRIGFLITSAEEGDDYLAGTPYVLEQLEQQGVKINYCVLGEPSSTKKTGDTLRVGRRGSLSATLKLFGKQGHVAYPELAENPIPIAAEVITRLSKEIWDQGNEFFPPTGFQISSVQAGTGATNVIPGEITLKFNFRFCTETNALELQNRTRALIEKTSTQFELIWQHSGDPFLTRPGRLISACSEAIFSRMGAYPISSTGGGTSDGRFISPKGIDVVECGPCNATIHQTDEHLEIAAFAELHDIYLGILTRFT